MSVSSTPSVTLVIKAPNQKIADQKIECTIDWTVRKLKQHLSKVYPTNPIESQQRIIYAGKLLLDDHRLGNVLKQYEPDQNVHTVHLVCMASMSDSQVMGSTPVQDAPEGVSLAEGLRRRLPTETQTSSVSPELNTSSRAFPSMNYQSYVHHPGMMYYGAAPPMVQPFASGFTPYGAEQLQWMQQAYAQSMMNYMQQFQQAAVQPHLVGQNQPVTPVIPVPLANQNFPNELPGAAIAEAEPPLQQMRINAQGGREVDDDEAAERGNGDWLDSTYIFVRFLMLMSILYFYSTPHRFLATLTLALIAYLGRAGWLRRGRRENRNAEEREAPPQQTPLVNAPQDTESSEDPEQETNMVDLQAIHRPSTFEVIWSVISSFFTSLIPENPPPININ